MTNLLYESYRCHCPEKLRQSCLMHFCMLVELTKRLKLLNHRSEPIVQIEVYHPYKQSVVIILSIFMMMRLLWLPFHDRYRKIMCIMGLNKGR